MKIRYYLLLLVVLAACSGETSKEVVVPQQNFIRMDQADLVVDNGPSTQRIAFSTAGAWKAVATSGTESWCTLSPASGKGGDEVIELSFTENNSYDERNVNVSVVSGDLEKSVLVTQKQKDALIVESGKIEVAPEGGTVSFSVKANVSYVCTIAKNVDWIHKQEGSRALKERTEVFSVDRNEGVAPRQGSIEVVSGNLKETVTVYQEGAVPTVVISKTEYVVPSEGEVIKIETRADLDFTYKLPAVDWITESDDESVSAHTLFFVVKENQGYESRSAQIEFTNTKSGKKEYVDILQMQKNALVVARPSYLVEYKSDELSIRIGHNVDFSVESNVEWIVPQPLSRTYEEKEIRFSIGANTSYDSREGIITFYSEDRTLRQEVKVVQAGRTGLFVSKNDYRFSSKQQTFDIELKTNISCEVTIPDNASWIHFVKSRALEQHTLSFSLDEHIGIQPRVAKIYIHGADITQIITITQMQEDALFVSKSEYVVNSSEVMLEMQICANSSFYFSINVDWIQRVLDVPEEIDERNKIIFLVSANPHDTDRVGYIYFTHETQTQRVKVIQYGKADRINLELVHSEPLFTVPSFYGDFTSGTIHWGDGTSNRLYDVETHSYARPGVKTTLIETQGADEFKIKTLGSISSITIYYNGNQNGSGEGFENDFEEWD